VTAIPNVAATRVVEPTLTLAIFCRSCCASVRLDVCTRIRGGAVPLKIPSAALATLVLNE
jgi:hypothetical protein